VRGLVDAHAHPFVGRGAQGPIALDAVAAMHVLADWARAGVSLVRDVGSPGGAALDLNPSAGLPRVQAAGRFLAPAGQYFPALLPEGAPADRLTALALGEVARGTRWVKVIADFPLLSGDAPSGSAQPTYGIDAIAELVAAVHSAGGRVAAHSTTDTVADLVRAGVDSIEHGTAIDDSTLRLMARTGAAWTPTLCAVLDIPPSAPESTRRRSAAFRSHLKELLPLAHTLGVPILTGTDTAGTLAREVSLLAQSGLAPADAVESATPTAYRFLDEGDPFGRPASLVTYNQDPREDLSVLASPTAVLINGVRVR